MANSGTEGGPLPRWSKRWWWWCVWWWWWWGCSCVGVEGKEECGEETNVAVVVVVSVFVTLVVVAIVLVVIYFVLRRRHGGFLFPPKRTRKSLMCAEEDANRIVSGDGCYDNPSFPSRDTVDLEEGMVSASSKRNSSPGKSPNKDQPQKKRSSAGLPRDEPDGPRRKVSGGSLDNHSGPETVTVCLQSQDIIGLGFNISGNMRDGIYVSQLHNRGPAIESGHIQVGDRIRSVTIAYDNMVYEDALTILSYASPYPVKVTLQKERAPAPDPGPGTSEQIHHPIYRSQSLDTLPHLPKEFQFKAKRWQSEMKSETRKDSPKRGEAERRVKALSQSLPPLGWGAPVPDVLDVRSDVMVHAADSADGSPDPAWYRLNQERRMTPVKKEALNSSLSSSLSGEDSLQPAKTRKKGKLEKEAAQGVESLMVDRREEDDETFWSQSAAIVSSSPKTPPSKPERKKKTSSSSIVSEDMPFESGNSSVEEIVCVAVKRAQVHALPPGLHDEGPEVEEEEIQPTHIKREVVINAEGFEFSPVEKSELETEAERPTSPNRFAYMSSPARPASPEGDPVEEDLIEAAVASRDIQMAPPSHSARAQGRNIYSETQGVSSLDDGSLENLILKTPLTTTSHDLDHRDTRQGLEENHSGVFLHNDAHRSSQDSDDFFTVDLSDTSRPGDRLGFNSSESDSHLQRYSQDNKENCVVDDLQWSGQRLVRSGSFTEIAHADSVSDWTDRNTFNDDDDDTSPTSGKSSAADNYADLESEVTSSRILPSEGMFKGRENLSNLSDLSNSVSSSRSSSPGLTNGPVSEGVAVLLPGSSGKHATTTTIDMLPASDSNANSKTVNFVVNYSAADNDADC